MKKINIYILIQIFKSCTLIFFIFTTIAWLMQFTRILTLVTTFKVDFSEVLFLSFMIIPNLIYIILPFITVFGLVLAFVKLNNDKELIGIFTSGISINEIVKPIIVLLISLSFLSIILGMYLSPLLYKVYKEKEFELRNKVSFENLDISNFIEIDDSLTLDFIKNEKGYFENILIHTNIPNDTLIISEKGKIENKNNNIYFNLENGNKLDIDKLSIENLNFDNYRLKFSYDDIETYQQKDINTLSIFDILESKRNNDAILILRIFDTLIIFSLVIFVLNNLIYKNDYSIKNIFLISLFNILVISVDNIFNDLILEKNIYFTVLIVNLIFFHIIYYFKKVQ